MEGCDSDVECDFDRLLRDQFAFEESPRQSLAS